MILLRCSVFFTFQKIGGSQRVEVFMGGLVGVYGENATGC